LWKVSGTGSTWQVAAHPIALASGVSGAAAQALACSPDGSTAYAVITAITTNYIAVADLSANSANLFELPDSIQVMNLTSLAVSADGQSLYACDSAGVGIRILNAKSLRIDQTLSWQSGVQMPYGIAAASDGSALFSANVNSQNIAIAQQVSPA
jgi:DNA-binding beta-propeller fold protein YncE